MSGQLIAIIEDETELRDFLSSTLKDEGYEVNGYESSEQFLKNQTAMNAQLIITDGRLPGQSGYDLISEVRKQDKATPILLMTGAPEEGDGAKALNFGADDYLVKPVEMSFLIAKVKRIFEKNLSASSPELKAYRLSKDTNELVVNDNKRIKFTGTEFEVFSYLFSQVNQLVERKILESHTSKARSLDVHVHAIRRKIKELPLKVETLKLKGYRLRTLEPKELN